MQPAYFWSLLPDDFSLLLKNVSFMRRNPSLCYFQCYFKLRSSIGKAARGGDCLEKGRRVKHEQLCFSIFCEKCQVAVMLPARSMGPKVKSAILFAEARGEKAIMTSIDRRLDVLKGKAGTTVYK